MTFVHIVDDDDAFRTSVSRLLLAAGYRTREYASATEFLGAAAPCPGCVLLDVHMPRMSGFELAAQLAQRRPALPVVFVTGQSDPAMADRAARLGAIDFLTKPVPPTQLLEAIDRGLARVPPAR